MTTDLFLVASGLASTTLARVVPPSCLRTVERAGAPRRDGDDAVIECGVWTPRRPAACLVPSFSALAATPPACRFELSARAAGAWSPWVATVTLGDAEFPALPAAAGPLTTKIDEVRAAPSVDAVRLRVRHRGALPDTWLVSLCAASEDRVAAGAPPAGAVSISVPPLSQLAEDPGIAMRVCSPTSVAMVLRYWGHGATTAAVAADAFHRATDLYGVWPAAIRAAGARGVAGYILRFPDWPAATWCLDRGLPVVASIRYAAGELTGAPMAATTGHLIVLTGYDDSSVLANDPAAPTPGTVPHRYRRDELTRAWLDGTGIGYILFDPTRA
jgi:hypothetical protein